MPNRPRQPQTQLDFWIALDRGGRMHFHEEGLKRAKAERLIADGPAVRSGLPISSNPAYNRLLDNLDERMNSAISAANNIAGDEPPLTPFPSHEEIEALLRMSRGRD